MTGTRRLTSYYLLALLSVWALAGLVLGIVLLPSHGGLQGAVNSTLGASNYTEDLHAVTTQSHQAEHLVFESPDKLGGYVERGSQRQYVVITGSDVYQSGVVRSSTPTDKVAFRKSATGQSNAAVANDPVQSDLQIVKAATDVKRNGDVYSFTKTSQGQTELFKVTVAGQYISDIDVSAPKVGHVDLAISSIHSSPSVALPAGATVSGS